MVNRDCGGWACVTCCVSGSTVGDDTGCAIKVVPDRAVGGAELLQPICDAKHTNARVNCVICSRGLFGRGSDLCGIGMAQ